MPHFISFIPVMAPAFLVLGALIAQFNSGLRPQRALFAVRWASLACGLVTVLCGILVAKNTILQSPLIGFSHFGLSFRLDALSAVMLGLIASLGIAVIQFSRNYMDGDPRQGAFMRDLSLTLAGVTCIVMAGNLFHLVLAWIGTSAALHQLLLFYRERRGARVAAHKKFIVARLSDASLIAAAILLAKAFGTSDIGLILSQARSMNPDAVPETLRLGTILIAFAAFFKSAQFPTHGWLAEVMEAPTPVSALLHAGIINGGAFLVVRFADVMALNPAALHLLLVVGGLTALFASLVMVTQSAVKTSLAYSSVAHMGFMLFQCGLGAFPLAIVHLVAHSFYKAHAFLCSASTVEFALALSGVAKSRTPGWKEILMGSTLALLVYTIIGSLMGIGIIHNVASIALGAIFVMGLTQLMTQPLADKSNFFIIARVTSLAAGASLAFFFLEFIAEHALATSIPVQVKPNSTTLLLVGMMIVTFLAVVLLQLIATGKMQHRRWQKAYVHIKNGFYVNTLIHRAIGFNRNFDLTKQRETL